MLLNPQATKLIEALGSGKLNTSELSRRVHLPRTTVEYSLRVLEKQKYVKSSKVGKATIWEQLYEESGEKIKVINGIDNIIKSLESAVSKKGLEVVIIESDKVAKIFESKKLNDLFQNLNKKIKEKNSLVYVLFHRSTEKRINKMAKSEQIKLESIHSLMDRAMSAYVVPENLFNLNTHIATVGEMVFISDFDKETSIRIKNLALAKFFKSLFELASLTQEKIDVGKVLREIPDPFSEQH